MTTDKAIYDFLKINHILFLTDDNFQFVCFKFFLVINDFLYEKYGLFSNYNDYLMNFYYLYYKYTQENHLYEFKEKILSRIDENNCAEFSLDNVACSIAEKLLKTPQNQQENHQKHGF